MPRQTGRKLAPALAIAAAIGASTPALAASTVERVSVGPGGVQGNSGSDDAAVSVDGRFVAFHSDASNLVPGDTNDITDVFVRDRQAGTTRRVSVGPGGAQADSSSRGPDITPNGRFVAFESDARNLVPGDTNNEVDVFLHDTSTGRTRLVSVRGDGVRGGRSSRDPAVSDDGRYVAFVTAAEELTPGTTGGGPHIVLRDMQTGTIRLVSARPDGAPGDAFSENPAISGNGLFVAFVSLAANLVPGDTNGEADVFVYDRRTRGLRRASVGQGGVQADRSGGSPTLSKTGNIVAFASDAGNLVPGDTNGQADVFVRDLEAGTTRRVSVGPGGRQGRRVSRGPLSLSATGRYVAFESLARLVDTDSNGRMDVYVHDTVKDTTSRVSVGPGGAQGDRSSDRANISADGRFVAFQSEATNLVPGDTNSVNDIFGRPR